MLLVVAVDVGCSPATGSDNTNDMETFEIVAEFAVAEPASGHGSVTWNHFALYVANFVLAILVAEGKGVEGVARVAGGEVVALIALRVVDHGYSELCPLYYHFAEQEYFHAY